MRIFMNKFLTVIGILWLIAVILFLLPVVCHSQTSRTITIPNNTWDYTDKAAANLYLSVRETTLIDTTVYVMRNSNVQWVVHPFDNISAIYYGLDSLATYVFSVDSIIGDGNARQVFLGTAYITDGNYKTQTWLTPNRENVIVFDVINKGRMSTLTVWLENVIGGSQLGSGRYQFAILHFQLKQQPTLDFQNRFMN
jgi:hypothetical protein